MTLLVRVTIGIRVRISVRAGCDIARVRVRVSVRVGFRVWHRVPPCCILWPGGVV